MPWCGLVTTRLYAILARKAPRAVVFRRGPSRVVLCLSWHTDTDRFEEGQWLRARIYERRSDLSPSGERLVYFAASFKPHGPGSWTAVSHPPWLTALAMWPKGDTWGGGGLFEDDKTLLLNHAPGDAGVGPPSPLRVRPLHAYAGRGEDDPIHSMRLARDGWRVEEEGKAQENAFSAKVWFTYVPPIVMAKTQPGGRSKHPIELLSITHGVHERNGAWYVMEHAVRNPESEERASLGRTDWADWDRNGDLLYAKHGAIFRLPRRAAAALDLDAARKLVDLNGHAFEARASPPEARRWR